MTASCQSGRVALEKPPASAAAAINARGQIIGGSRLGVPCSHAFCWFDGRMSDLGALGGSGGAARRSRPRA